MNLNIFTVARLQPTASIFAVLAAIAVAAICGAGVLAAIGRSPC